MTYAQFLLIFLVPPLLVLGVYWVPRLSRMQLGFVGFWALVAVVYTTPWDNYLVAQEVWWYDTEKVIGRIGYVPIEEYAFFVLQSLMMGLWMHTLNAWLPKPQGQPRNNPRFRYLNTAVLLAVWLVCWYLLLFGGEQWTYFGLILTWAIFPIMIQTFFGADILWHRRGLIFVGILTGTSYLATADAIAIDLQIWTISPDKTLSILLGGVLPKEEALFFLVTNILIVVATTFTLEQESFRRLDATLKSLRLRHPAKPILGEVGQD